MKYNIFKSLCAAGLFTVALASCSDKFLEEKRPYGSFGPSEVYNDIEALKLRLNYIYQKSLPAPGGGGNAPDIWPIGTADLLSKHTEEFTGYGKYNDPTAVISNQNIDKFFYYGVNESPWKKMRECTDVIVRTAESETLTDLDKQQTIAQARFFRATRYYRLWKRYGGLPIITDIQSTLLRDTVQLRAKRTSTEETFRFIIDDLKLAGDNLPTRWEEEVNDWGRVTAGAAYALAGFIANYYASPIFNRQDDKTRWQEAYELNKTALEKLNAGHFGLAYSGNPGVNASNWAKIWGNVMGGESQNSEAVFMVICNNITDSNDRSIFNSWEQNIRPKNARGGGSITPTAQMVDLFPMADGKRPAEAGQYTYDKKLFFLNRDPRFYRTFAFPGTEWQFNGAIEGHEDACPYPNGSEYQLQNYAWYESFDESNVADKAGFYTDKMGEDGQSLYVRKKSQDKTLGQSTLYNFTTENGFSHNAAPVLAMRYAEVLLNFAEAACGAEKLQEAWDALIKIRQRVGYTGDCGLDPAIKSNRAKMFEAILYERQVELAYEGKRFDDCHRWMLFDGGVKQAEIGGESWAPTGWGGNTCTYLGVTPLDQVNIKKIELYLSPSVYTAARNSDNDPFVKQIPVLNDDGTQKTDANGEPVTKSIMEKPKALTLNEDFTTSTTVDASGVEVVSYNNADVQALANFYNQYLERKDILTMTVANEEGTGYQMPKWSNNCYLMGLGTGDENNNPNVAQTKGWNRAKGGSGAYDPLSKTPDVDSGTTLPSIVTDAILDK